MPERVRRIESWHVYSFSAFILRHLGPLTCTSTSAHDLAGENLQVHTSTLVSPTQLLLTMALLVTNWDDLAFASEEVDSDILV